MTGTSFEILQNAILKVAAGKHRHEELPNISGKMRKNFIRILPGDRILIGPYAVRFV